jgi:DNA modification methylase
LTSDEFMEATTDVWEIASESATRVGYPAPFPVELPERLIQLYTYRRDLVLDPLMGSGTTAVAAVRTDRHYVGYDTDPVYVERARERVDVERANVSARVPPDVSAARDLAHDFLVRGGYTDIRRMSPSHVAST